MALGLYNLVLLAVSTSRKDCYWNLAADSCSIIVISAIVVAAAVEFGTALGVVSY